MLTPTGNAPAPRRVLVLCTGNSCRSQMAEALINLDLAGRWSAVSAGTEPAGYVHPGAVTVMGELGLDLSHQSSKSVDLFRDEKFDVVLTVCDDAAENCPVWLGGGARKHIAFLDPARATGDETTILATFRTVRDQIRSEVIGALQALDQTA
jgi:arsenate reductase